MNATRTWFGGGVRRISAAAVALLLLALLAGGAGYLIHAMSATETATQSAPAASSEHAQYPVGEGHQWSQAAAPSGGVTVNPVGEGHYPG